jgi:PAS domain S-box-containing protein
MNTEKGNRLIPDTMSGIQDIYRQIVDTTNEGIWTINADGRTTLVNPAMAEMLGYTTDEITGQPFTDFMDAEAVAVAAVAFDPRRTGINEKIEFCFRNKNGSDVWTRLSPRA